MEGDDLDITESELLEALRKAFAGVTDTDGYLTMAELEAETGASPTAILRELHRLDRQGLLDVAEVKKPNIARRLSSKPAYKMLSEAESAPDS